MDRPPRSTMNFADATSRATKPPARRPSQHRKSDVAVTLGTNTCATEMVAAEAENEQLQQDADAYGHGSFQRRIFGFNIVALLVLQCHSQVLGLIAPPLDHWCKPPKRFANLSVALWKNVGIPVDETGHYSRCFVYAFPGQVNDSTIVPCYSWDYDENERYRTIRSFWNLVCRRTWLLSMTDAVYMSGALFLVPVSGYLADTHGRKPAITGAVLALVFSSIAACAAEPFGLYLVARFISSASASMIHLLSVILLLEVIPLKFRTFYVGFSCSLGSILADLVFLLLRQLNLRWSVLHAAVASPALLLLSAPCIIPESPIWLMAMGRTREAEDVILKAARTNGVERSDAEKAMATIMSEMGRGHVIVSPMTPRIIVDRGPIRTRASGVFFSTFAVMLGFFITSWSSPFLQQNAVRLASLVFSAPSYLAMYVALNSMGRLKLLTALTALLGGLSSLCGIAIYARPIEVSYGLAVIAKASASVLIPTNYLYITELFPTSVRSAVMSAAYTCGRIGAVLAAILGPLKIARREDLVFGIAALAAFANIAVLMGLPETSIGTAATVEVEKTKDLMDVMQQSLSPMRPRRDRTRRRKSKRGNES